MITAPVREIHQIEITSRCNLACVYCPHPGLQREKQDMDAATFERTMDLVGHYIQRRTQGEVSLTGVGEPLLHPRFAEFLLWARHVISPVRKLVFATNGLLLDDAACERIKEADPTVYVSMHRPEVAAKALNALRRHGIKHGTNDSFATSAYDWAGQVQWEVTAQRGTPCPWLRDGRAFIGYNGDVLRCCFDGDGVSKIGTVWEDVSKMQTGAYRLCSKCHHSTGYEVGEVL